MFHRYSINYVLFAIVADSCAICLSLAIATYLRPELGFLSFAAEFPKVIPTPWVIYLVFCLEWSFIAFLASVYDGRRNLHRVDEFSNLSVAILLATVALAGTLYLSYREVSRLLFVVFILLSYLSMLVWRSVARRVMQYNSSDPRKRRRVLIVGAGPVGKEFAQKIGANPLLGLKVVGFLDDNPLKSRDHPEIIGAADDVTKVVQAMAIDDVVLALPQRAYRRIHQMVVELHRLPVKVWVIPDYFRLALHRAAVEEFAGIPMLDLRAPALSETQRLAKRAFDLAVTLAVLPAALPLMAVVAVAIRLTHPGSVLYRQARVGENGAIFQMLKFRTMGEDADQLRFAVKHHDDDGNLIYKAEDDPRVTPLGRWLRRASLDELPQLFNVLKGEMSLVGPRPELPALVNKYSPWQRQRFAVPQGMTGWWQIHGRSDRPMHLNTEEDLYYVHHFSLWLDVYILIKTVGVVIMGKGAY